VILERDFKKLTTQAIDVIETCRVSQSIRTAAYRSYAQWIETGRASGELALANQLYGFLDRLASHLFSPDSLRFVISSASFKSKAWIDKFGAVGRALSEEWENKNIDMTFGFGVKEALAYGACILKQSVEETITKADTGEDLRIIDIDADLVMPWQFGVYNEGENSISKQEAVVETVMLTKAEVWRRVRYLPDAAKLYKRILGSSSTDGASTPSSFMHQVLSTAVLDTTLANATRPMPGGIVQLSNSPSMGTLGPTVAAELYPMHQLYVKDDDTDDYTTFQIIDPDIMVAPYNNGKVTTKRNNIFCPNALPYTLIQPNFVAKYFWGRSEVVDLIMLQSALSGTLDDVKRIIKLMLDKLLGVSGWEGDPMELMAQFRTTGVIQIPPGGKIDDLTPQLPEVVLRFVEMLIQMMERVSGFSNILSGSGEPGVRAGVHADTLMRTASPRLRDRSLLLERQCATAADTSLAVWQAKDARVFWTNEEDEASDFLLSQLPADRRVSVDSHSTSPIYHDDHQNLISWGVKAGFIGGDSAIEELPFQHKDLLLARYKEMQQQKQAMLAKLEKEDPIAFARAIGGHSGGHGGGKKAA
jgi:hypothetical protein